ncbi:MAG: X-Pro dipeptidyl-peptidase (S15 family), partial [Mycobacterium sp.]|nr:X-Pro dipeptidyl-peptidase (S15 family) [Mycobacterium sp.]
NNGFTFLPYANWLDAGGAKGTEQIRVGIRELTLFDAVLINVPVVGMVAAPVINLLQDTPLISDLLAPLIGSSVVATIDVDVTSLAPGDTPVAFTYDVESFDGVKLSTNFFPAAQLASGATAPTTIIAPGFGAPGGTRPYDVYALKNEVPGIATMRALGYNVVTFDPRGEFDSGGVMRTAEPNYEGRDTSAIISWIAGSTPAALNAPGDPRVGMVGGSYGGALQLATAEDPRIDAMVPVGNWNTLLETFYPAETFKSAYGALYLLNLIISGARVDPQLYWAVATGLGLNWLGPWSKELMNASTPPLDQLRAPTLLGRGMQDVLVPLEQGDEIAETVLGNGLGTAVKTFWFTGGHGAVGLLPDDQSARLIANTVVWLDSYVKGNGSAAQSIPNFQWYDQTGAYYSSPLLSFQDGFNNLPDVIATAPGGLLGILPLLGGSGPGVGVFPLSLVNASPATNAIDVAVPSAQLGSGTQVVGAPTVSFSYRGLGTSGAVFAQVIDNATGAVLGNVVTPVPVVLDGRERTVTADIAEIAYTVGEGDSLTVQITSSATAFANAAFGVIDIANITVTLPNRTA